MLTNFGQIDSTHQTGLWFEEFAVPYEIFLNEGYVVRVVSPRGGRVPVDPRSLPDSLGGGFHAQAMRALEHTLPLAEMKVEDFDAIFFPGGHGTMWDLPASAEVTDKVSQFAAAGKLVAAVCHGPAGLVNAKQPDGRPLVAGRRVTGFTNEEERATPYDSLVPFHLETRLRELGAEFVPGAKFQEHVVVDGTLITGQNPASSAAIARAVTEALQR